MSGEFIRTPKHGVQKGRYRVRTDLPLTETLLAVLSFGSAIASVETGHYFATPFAVLFTIGYAYVAVLVAQEQATRRREPASSPVAAWEGERSTDPAAATWPAPRAAEERPMSNLAA